MILYHGSNQLITKIDLSKSKNFKDFGRGFYLTKDYARAVAMAQRTTAIMGDGSPEVSPFIFNPSRCPSDVRIKIFDGRTAEWALFVQKNREKDPLHTYKLNTRPMITDKLEIEKLLSRLTTYIANKLHLSTIAAVGAVCMSKVANELAGGKMPKGTTFEELSERLLKEVTMAR